MATLAIGRRRELRAAAAGARGAVLAVVEVLQRHLARGHHRRAVDAASDQRAQVDVGQHALLHQEPVGLVVRLGGQRRDLQLHRALDARPGVRPEIAVDERADDDLGQLLRTEQVVVDQFVQALERRDAGLQVVQLPDGHVDDGLGQARDEDLLLHRLVVDQHQLLRVSLHRREQRAGAGGGPVGDCGVAQHLALALDPLLAMAHQGLQRVATLLRHRALGGLVQEQAGRLQHGGKQARPRLGKLLGEHLPGPARDIWRQFAIDHPAFPLPLG